MLAVLPFIADCASPLRAQMCDVSTLPSGLCAAWRALADDVGEPNSFMEHWFFRPSLEYCRDGIRVQLIAVWADDLLVGVIPLANMSYYGRIWLRHTVNWRSGQSFYGAPLVRAGWEMAFWTTVLAALDTNDFAPSFLSISGLDEDGSVCRGLVAAATALRRPSPVVHSFERALLASALPADTYLDQAVRGKKRKELRRLRNRLAEQGTLHCRSLTPADDVESWIAEFMQLEAAGWKGVEGAAFANTAQSTKFFEAIMHGAYDAGVLDFQRIDLDGRAIAMLINFIRPPGSFSFKIAYDETLARFSPGVLIELENLTRVLADPNLSWMDSCAAADHPMINSLWRERRKIVQVTVPLKGFRRRTFYLIGRGLERSSAALRAALRR